MECVLSLHVSVSLLLFSPLLQEHISSHQSLGFNFRVNEVRGPCTPKWIPGWMLLSFFSYFSCSNMATSHHFLNFWLYTLAHHIKDNQTETKQYILLSVLKGRSILRIYKHLVKKHWRDIYKLLSPPHAALFVCLCFCCANYNWVIL